MVKLACSLENGEYYFMSKVFILTFFKLQLCNLIYGVKNTIEMTSEWECSIGMQTFLTAVAYLHT